jgi:hypothetical protein
MSDNRANFLSKLFSRKRPAGLSEVRRRINCCRVQGCGQMTKPTKNLQDITNLLVKHKFGLTNEDQLNIEHVYSVFREWGPDINYNSGTLNGRGRGGGGMPNYVDVMTATDPQGQERSYLATEENYRFLRDFEGRNMLIPLTGDFGGKKAIRAVGEYLKDHGAVLGAFYLSNVENYLFQNQGGPGNPNGGAANFYGNVATLPLDSSSTFIRSRSGVRAVDRRRLASAKRTGFDRGDTQCRGKTPNSRLSGCVQYSTFQGDVWGRTVLDKTGEASPSALDVGEFGGDFPSRMVNTSTPRRCHGCPFRNLR